MRISFGVPILFKRLLDKLSQSRLLLGLMLAVVGLVVFVLLSAIGVYVFGWHNPISRLSAKIVPFPVAYVDGEVLTYGEFSLQAKLLEHGTQGGDDKRTRILALDNAINQEIVQKEALTRGLVADSQEIYTVAESLLGVSLGDSTAATVSKERYGITKSQLIALAELQILREKLEKALKEDANLIAIAKAKAKEVYSRAKEGEKFENLVAIYSSHPSVTQDMPGLISVSEAPELVRKSAQGMKDGEVLNNAVVVGNSFYVVKRIGVEKGELLLQIIVTEPADLSEWLRTRTEESNIVRLLPKS